MPCRVSHALNPSRGRRISELEVSVIHRVPGQPGLHRNPFWGLREGRGASRGETPTPSQGQAQLSGGYVITFQLTFQGCHLLPQRLLGHQVSLQAAHLLLQLHSDPGHLSHFFLVLAAQLLGWGWGR